VADVPSLGPAPQAAEEKVDVGLRRLTLCAVGGVDGAHRSESHGQSQTANNGQSKDAKHVAKGCLVGGGEYVQGRQEVRRGMA